MLFVDDKDINEIIIPTISEHFDACLDPFISYKNEPEAYQNYLSLLERIKSDWFGDTIRRASYLFINTNQHIFSNGNKRLSLVTTIVFLEKNNIELDDNLGTKEFLRGMTKILGEEVFFSVLNEINENIGHWKHLPYLGFYMMSIIIADKKRINFMHLQHDELVDLVEIFLKFIIK